MKKITFLSAMLLVMVSAFAADTPAYRPHGFRPFFRPVYGHGIHPGPLYPAHQHMHFGPVTAFPGAAGSTPVAIKVSLPDFTISDASIEAMANTDMTAISLAGFAEADAAMNALALSEMTRISLPDFSAADAAMSAQAILDITKISLPDYTKADAEMSSRW